MSESAVKKIGLFGLIGMVVSSCIGSGVFALTGQLAEVASPGGVLVAWGVVGVGFLMLALALNYLGKTKPELVGIFQYAEEGFGAIWGFISGWGYWLSAWLGNVAFATVMMTTVGFFYPEFATEVPTPLAIVIASVVMWALSFLIIRGVEGASVINAIVMVCKVAVLVIFLAFAVVLFDMGVFTADFWGNVYNNLVASAPAATGSEEELVALGGIPNQVVNCIIIMMWAFIGIEGATVMSSRARRQSDVGKATVIGIICLLVIYLGATVLPYGFLPYTEIAAMDSPAMVYIFDQMAPGWGGAFISIGIIVAIAGAWLSFIILPVETTSEMAARQLLPAGWGKLNKNGAPSFSLLITAICTQAFMASLIFTSDAYDFAFSMCTVAIVITWTLAALYQLKVAKDNKAGAWMLIGVIAVLFQLSGVLFNGWSFLLLTCVGYIPGFILYAMARKKAGFTLSKSDIVTMTIISALGVLAIALLATGVIAI